MDLSPEAAKAAIARRVAMELRDGDVVNLGIGLPTLVAGYLPAGVSILLESENGMIGMGPKPGQGGEDPDIVDAGGGASSILPGGAFFDSAFSFGLIRGGHVDVCVLGALQVDAEGNLASWIVPGVLVPGMGGAMDLVTGAKRVIVAMQHCAKGKPKLLERCGLPLTAKGEVDLVVTEYGVFDFATGRLRLVERHPEASVEEIRAATGAAFAVAPVLGLMKA